MLNEEEAIKDIARNEAQNMLRQIDEPVLDSVEKETQEQPTNKTQSHARDKKAQATPKSSIRSLDEECEECWIATAVNAINTLCQENPEKMSSRLIDEVIGRDDIEPNEWIRRLRQTCEQSQSPAKNQCELALNELKQYLKKRNSPYLKGFTDEEEK